MFDGVDLTGVDLTDEDALNALLAESASAALGVDIEEFLRIAEEIEEEGEAYIPDPDDMDVIIAGLELAAAEDASL